MTNLLVMKFGGTSMGSAERIKVAAQICQEQKERRPVVAVVSAMSQVTDLLLNTLRHAEAGDEAGIEANLERLAQRHLEACDQLLSGGLRDTTASGIRALMADFRRIAHGMLMLGERPPRSVDEAVAIGERFSALLISEYLQSTGIPAADINGSDVIVTDAVFGNATPMMDETRKKAGQTWALLMERGVIPVVTGFNGATVDGRPRRSGAADRIFPRRFSLPRWMPRSLWIWTDVDGIMSADPSAWCRRRACWIR